MEQRKRRTNNGNEQRTKSREVTRERDGVTSRLAGLVHVDEVVRGGAVEEAQVEAAYLVLADVGAADLGPGLERAVYLLQLDDVAGRHRRDRREHPRAAPADVLGDRALLLQDRPGAPEAAEHEVDR